MRAVIFREHGGPEVLEYTEVPTPAVGPNEALIRVRACGLNRLDVLVRAGTVPQTIPRPHIPGSEVAGEVAAVGANVTHLTPGQRVVVHPYLSCGLCEYCLAGAEELCLRGDILGLRSNGGYAEYVCVPAAMVVPLPEPLSFSEGAALTLSTLTAWHMLVTRARLRPGEDVLVLAAGSNVGSAAIQIARLCGARRVFATVGSPAKVAPARALGADHVIVGRETDFAAEVRRLTGRRGVDVVVEHVGAATWERSIASLTRGGRLVSCGALTGRHGQTDLAQFFGKELQLLGCFGGTRAELRQVLQAAAEGRLRAVIDSRFPLAEAAAAQQRLEASAHFGKIVLEV